MKNLATMAAFLGGLFLFLLCVQWAVTHWIFTLPVLVPAVVCLTAHELKNAR